MRPSKERHECALRVLAEFLDSKTASMHAEDGPARGLAASGLQRWTLMANLWLTSLSLLHVGYTVSSTESLFFAGCLSVQPLKTCPDHNPSSAQACMPDPHMLQPWPHCPMRTYSGD